MPSLRHEKRAYDEGATVVAGVDEAGRGPLAGPVVAAAAILPREFRHKTLNDSKQLTPEERDEIYAELTARKDIQWAVGVSEVEVIEAYNILRATWRAMVLALDALSVKPDFVLVDGLRVPAIHISQKAIVGGDAKSFSIAAASVIAKVTRDRMMLRVHEQFPQYNFAQHKGYATPEHLAALERFGACPIHRKTFEPVRLVSEPVQADFNGLDMAS
ncbi:MAG TPA: ribonuclease HII [Verrucomicrobiae bacterium]|nr:ribonuclease HII [Verrucomicrobiae bacterium]